MGADILTLAAVGGGLGLLLAGLVIAVVRQAGAIYALVDVLRRR